MAKFGDWKRVSQFIMTEEIRGEPILFFKNEGYLVFKRYYSGPNRLQPLPAFPDEKRYDLQKMRLRDEQQISTVLGELEFPNDRFWLVTSGPQEYMHVRSNLEILENFIRKHGTVLKRQVFYDSQVRLIRYDRAMTQDG